VYNNPLIAVADNSIIKTVFLYSDFTQQSAVKNNNRQLLRAACCKNYLFNIMIKTYTLRLPTSKPSKPTPSNAMISGSGTGVSDGDPAGSNEPIVV